MWLHLSCHFVKLSRAVSKLDSTLTAHTSANVQLLCYPLAAIFNASLREGFFPLIWKSANVVAIPKVHPPTSIQNDLRPISLLPTVAKFWKAL